MADFGKPYVGTLGDFDGLTYPQILAELDGSAGGTWLDLSGAGLSRVGFIRFDGTGDGPFELDAVSLASGKIGAPVPEPMSGLLLAVGRPPASPAAAARTWHEPHHRIVAPDAASSTC